jgi:YcaO-like protein with predicted kinase domain
MQTHTAALGLPSPKTFRRGTHRTASPADTLARYRYFAARMGITRLGNITGLDRIGIPVAVAVRPNSRSVSVSQGKGLDLPQAMASALMEAIEGYHAEMAEEGRRSTYRELAAQGEVVDPGSLCSTGKPCDPEAEIAWTEGFDLLRREPCWVPTELVHADYTRPLDGYFPAGSNGLASGNHPAEALSAAICELIERDAIAVWAASGIRARAQTAIHIVSIDDRDCRGLLAKYGKVGVDVRVWDATTDIGIAAFVCDIRDPALGEPNRLRRFHGAGCHPDRAIALSRALTEAAQARLTYIAGMRDDILPEEYQEPPEADIADALLDALAADAPPRTFGSVPTFTSDDLTADIAWEADRLRAAGITRVVVVDLARPELGIPVVRVVIPGLDGDIKHPHYTLGPRARRAAGLA